MKNTILRTSNINCSTCGLKNNLCALCDKITIDHNGAIIDINCLSIDMINGIIKLKINDKAKNINKFNNFASDLHFNLKINEKNYLIYPTLINGEIIKILNMSEIEIKFDSIKFVN